MIIMFFGICILLMILGLLYKFTSKQTLEIVIFDAAKYYVMQYFIYHHEEYIGIRNEYELNKIVENIYYVIIGKLYKDETLNKNKVNEFVKYKSIDLKNYIYDCIIDLGINE